MKFGVDLSRFAPIVRGTGFFLCWRADECELLNAGDVVWIGTVQTRARNFFLVQFNQDVLLHRFLKQVFVFAIGPVTPKNVFRLGENLHLVDPIEHGLVRRFAVANSGLQRNGRRDVLHGNDLDLVNHEWTRLNTNPSVRPLK